jgi:prevent-host-death family protein
MNVVAAQEIKRRGIGAVDEAVRKGPVRIVKNNRPRYVVLTETDYEQMVGDLAEARLASSEADLKAGRVRRGSAADLMREIRRDG